MDYSYNNYNDDFSVEILADLINQGLQGNELLETFKMQRSKVKLAINNLLNDAKDASIGKIEFASYHDVFN